MALLDRCIFNATSSGTGSFVEASNVAGFQTMEAAGAVDGQTYSYVAQSADLSSWEVGTGVYTLSTKTLARTTVLFNSLGTTAKINFTAAPQVLLTALASDFLQLSGQNLTWYVATTGSDSNPGTSALPFLTIQKAVNVAAAYNYQNLYTATINVADGTYAGCLLPALVNYPYANADVYPYDNSASFPLLQGDVGTPANCKVQNAAGDAISTQPFARWRVKGFQTKSSSGSGFDIFAQYYSMLGIDSIDFAGNGQLLGASNYSTIFALNGTGLTVSTAAAVQCFYAVGNALIINDSTLTTFTNSPAFSNYVCWLENWSFLGKGTFANGGTVTGNRFKVAEQSFLEYGGTRSSFPGNGLCTLFNGSTFAGDTNSVLGTYFNTSPTLANTIAISDGAGNLQQDYSLTKSGCWTLTATAGFILQDTTLGINVADFAVTQPDGWTFAQTIGDTFAFTTANVNDSAIALNNTSTGAHRLIIFTAGASGAIGAAAGQFGYFDGTSNKFAMVLTGSNGAVDIFGTLGWSTGISSYVASDTGLSRTAAAILAVGNGTAGDASGTIKAATVNATSAFQANGTPGISVTVTTAKVTPVTGANGSMTFVNGILTAQTQAT